MPRRRHACARSRPRLASRASSRRRRPRPPWRGGCDAREPRPRSCRSPTEARGRRSCSARRSVRLERVPRRFRPRARGADPRAPGRHGRRRERGGDPARSLAAGRARRLEPRARRADRPRRPVRAAARLPRRHRDDGRRVRACSRCWTSCRRRRSRSATCGRRSRRRRGSSGRRRARSPTTCSSSSAASQTTCSRSRSSPAPAPRGAWARRLRRSARSSSPARPTCWTRSASANAPAAADLVVTGEGTVDRTTFDGKAPGEALRVCEELGVRCVLFGGRVEDGVEARTLSGDPASAREDLEELGLGLGGA